MLVEPKTSTGPRPRLSLLPMVIFGSRWRQLPLNFGLIVGGYETFVSRLDLQGHPDEPEWLGHVNASVLKIKLAMAIIGISSIALLRTFIEAGNLGSDRAGFTETGVMWQVLIHITFVVSAIGIAFVDKLSDSGMRKHAE